MAEIDRQAEIDYVLKEDRIKLVIEMLSDGEPMNKIIKYSKLSEEEILEIKNEMENTN